jgi:DNA-binding CsgD family transcriptional regulator
MALAPHNLAVESRARHAVGLAELAAGRAAAAVDELGRAYAILRAGGVVEPAAVPVAGDLAEALALAGRGAEAAEALGRLEEGVARTGRVGQAAVAARVRALLADDAAVYETALALPGAAPLDVARTLLRYGQWLRRGRKRQRARARLEAALAAFEAAGAKPWADRAREELSPNAAAAPDDSDGLTPHEWRIAYAAAQGSTSPEIAARMLLSVRTVDYHLGNVYRKLGIRSRRELAGRLD